jgi:glycosyltransferase involved in cell wall biosynthesis
MKILFVHEVSWFNKVVFEMHDFPELLSLKGHEVHFLDFDEGKPRARWKSVTTTETRAHEGSNVSVTTPPRFLPGIFGRLLATIIQPLVFVRLIKQIEPDVVVTYSIPTSGWQITKICNTKNIPIIARAIDISHLLRKTAFKPLIKRSEKYIFAHADHVSTHNEALRQYCISLGASPNKTSVIFPGVDFSRFTPGPPRVDLQNVHGINPEDKVLLFMGTLFRFSGLFELLTELAPTLYVHPSIKILILGDGEDFNRLNKLYKDLGLQSQVLMPGRIEYDLLADYLRLGNVALLPFKQDLVTHSVLPGKILQYLACGLPTVATPLDGLMSMIQANNGVVYSSSPHQMAMDAIRLVSEPKSLKAMKNSGLNLVMTKCNWEQQIIQFENVVTTLSKDIKKGAD